MIRIHREFKEEEYAGIDGISRYEVWCDKRDLKEIKESGRVLKKYRYILPTLAYLLFTIPVIVGFIAMYQGILWGNVSRYTWGLVIFIIGAIYELTSFSEVKNMEIYLLRNGVITCLIRWSYKIRKPIMKKIGKRYWFGWISFSAVKSMFIKDLPGETKALIILTKDGKHWPHPKYGIIFNPKLKKEKEFIDAIIYQYEKWKSEDER